MPGAISMNGSLALPGARLRPTEWGLYGAAPESVRERPSARADAGVSGRGRGVQAMGDGTGDPPGQGIEAVLIANRAQLLRFLAAHGAGDAAEDLLQELWLRMSEKPTGPIANPLSYLYRAANNLMIDRHRADRQARLRDQAWTETRAVDETSPEPSAEDALISREELRRMDLVLSGLGERPAYCFRRFRLDGVPQKQLAEDLGVSLSTVESDLRRAYAALLAARRQSDDV